MHDGFGNSAFPTKSPCEIILRSRIARAKPRCQFEVRERLIELTMLK